MKVKIMDKKLNSSWKYNNYNGVRCSIGIKLHLCIYSVSDGQAQLEPLVCRQDVVNCEHVIY